MPFQLAQCNVVKLRAPLESPVVAGFVAALEPLNAVADAAPGFVWRLKTDAGDATSIRVFADDQILLNMSVWESIEALKAYVFQAITRRSFDDVVSGPTVSTAPNPRCGGSAPGPFQNPPTPSRASRRWSDWGPHRTRSPSTRRSTHRSRRRTSGFRRRGRPLVDR